MKNRKQVIIDTIIVIVLMIIFLNFDKIILLIKN